MVYILSAFLGIPLLLLVHAYIIFPLWMMYAGKRTEQNSGSAPDVQVAILIAVYNEEKVIKQKLESTLNSTFPFNKLTIWVASDASTDGTDAILKEFANAYPQITYLRFKQRTGKPQVINHIAERANADILVFTDADALFYPDTLPNLLGAFQDPVVGGVQANVLTRSKSHEQVAKQEIHYSDREIRIKQGEGAKGAVIGADGTCYAIRKSLFRPVPEGFYVDDFFLFMSILQQGYKTCFANDAYCITQVSGDSGIQFQRKVRISKGNFQNLRYFGMLGNPFKSFASYAFLSHKVIRWFGPFLMIIMLVANCLLTPYHEGFKVILGLQFGFYGLGLLDLGFRRLNWYITLLRFISHFLLMNVALLVGLLQHLTTTADGRWDSTPKA